MMLIGFFLLNRYLRYQPGFCYRVKAISLDVNYSISVRYLCGNVYTLYIFVLRAENGTIYELKLPRKW